MITNWHGIVTQKKDIKRQKERLDAMKKEAEEERTRVRAAARERVLLEFEKGQLGLAGGPTVAGTKSGSSGSATGSESMDESKPSHFHALFSYQPTQKAEAPNANSNSPHQPSNPSPTKQKKQP